MLWPKIGNLVGSQFLFVHLRKDYNGSNVVLGMSYVTTLGSKTASCQTLLRADILALCSLQQQISLAGSWYP